ncbi:MULTISPECIES: recombinase family protein [Mycobacteriales]|uniref:Recombinase family protein n=1 Tax=Tsukamurella spumae TaxID=44753 RepID=A0A846X852_9ACTN|nr:MULTISPECIES: recombinase family protein [Mycobacteriales]ATD71731.1 DNA resolvase [Gordonia sp. 1D]MCZ4652712.1 recombinase family protein [Gordonia amicalis]NKY20459.1 recombinase family protein [Tsukamurella spumae]
MKIGYARVSTGDQDLAAQTDALKKLGVDEKRIYIDHGLTGTNRSRPGLREALAAASRPGDELVVTKLDRLARSIRDAKDIADELAGRGVTLRLGASAYDPTDPMGRMMFNVLATFAEFEADLIRMRTREGMAVAKARGRLRGKQPKLSTAREKRLVADFHSGEYTVAELADDYGVSRATVYRAVQRAGDTA